jgi:hypothetical protein
MDNKMKSLVAGTAFLMAGAANAAVSYEVVSADSLLGDIIVGGDSASFLPTALSASASGGATVTTDVTVIKITSDKAITSIDYFASGDYTNLVDFSSPFEGAYASGQLNYSGDASGSMFLTVDGLGSASSPMTQLNYAWTEGATLTFDAADNVTEVFLSIQNDLFAIADTDFEIAKIQKKLVEIDTTVVPLPAAAWMFGAAILAFAGMARRKQA